MSLMDDANELVQSITNDLGDFSTSLKFTSPSNQESTINGIYSDHTLMYDENGQAMNGNQSHVTISEKFLTDQGYSTRDNRGFIDLVGHKVLVTRGTKTDLFIIDDTRPDDTVGMLLLFLSIYVD